MAELRLAERTAVITGAASGIGRETALLFADHGAAICLVDRDERGGEDVARRILEKRGRAVFVQADVSVGGDSERAVAHAVDAFGAIDILCNNAGIIRRASVVDTSEEEWDRIMAVNVKSVFLLSQRVMPIMVERGGGAIINTASGWGIVGGVQAAAYCASKGAVVQLTKAMALDHAKQNIRVNCICPGDTDTPMLREEARQLGVPEERFIAEAARRPIARVGRPEDVAQAALYLASDAASFVTGAVLVVDGGGTVGSA